MLPSEQERRISLWVFSETFHRVGLLCAENTQNIKFNQAKENCLLALTIFDVAEQNTLRLKKVDAVSIYNHLFLKRHISPFLCSES